MPDSNTNTEAFTDRAIYSDIYPLDEFYQQRGAQLPLIGRVKPEAMTEPYNSLLVHEGDMTSRLEAFHHDTIHIELLKRHTTGNEYFREVVLKLNGSERPVEFGAIKINLDLFPDEARAQILEEKRPLGQILKESKISHSSRPRFYLTVTADRFISKALNLTEAKSLFGRRNTLIDQWERPLAEIVEILPP